MDGVHQNMDQVYWSMDPLFLLALKLVVIKDYECILHLCYNLNSCLLSTEIIIFANSWKFLHKKFSTLRNLHLSEKSPQPGPQIDNDFIFYSL